MTQLDLSPYHILLVDDEVFSRETAAHIIRSIGQPTLYQAGDGREALERLRDHPGINLIICDFKMPKMNGLDLLRAIRTGASPAKRDVPFAMLTSYSEKHLVHAALSLDVNAFLIKPISKKVLVDRLQRMLAVMGDPNWLKPAGAYDLVDTDMGSGDADEARETVFDKLAEREFAAARVARALVKKKPAPGEQAKPRLPGRFSALSGKFKDSDLAGDIASGVERLASDMGRDRAIEVIDHLDGLQKRGVLSLNDIAGTLNPEAPPRSRPAAPGGEQVEALVPLDKIPDGAQLTRDIKTKGGDTFIASGIELTPLIQTILMHLNNLDVLDLLNSDGDPAVYARIAKSIAEKLRRDGFAPAPGQRHGGPERRVTLAELTEGDLLSRNIYTEDGRLYMSAGAELTGRLISLLRDLSDLETISPEIWVQG